jgi:type I restriction-modification system DNA methylase subunit
MIKKNNNKKLNNSLIEDISYNNYLNLIMEESISISNKDALKDKIHEIHNYLRNNGAGYGMNALKVFNIIYGLKKIEENNLLDKVNLKRPDCEFTYLLKLANENKDEKLAELIFSQVLPSIFNSNVRDLIFYKIPQNIKGSVLVYLIKEINKITLIEKSCNVLLSGKIYEYFIGRDESAISELGAYFTDRHIVEYIYNKLQPTLNDDNTLDTMIDMFGGSGGFTTGYINYIKNNYENINWETEIGKIYHYDMNEDVIKSAGLEFFCLTGVLPNMKNLQYKNSFTDEFVDEDGKTKLKYKYVITNPPYGGDKNKKSQAQTKREKIKEYINKEILNIKDKELLKRRQIQLKTIENQEKQEKKEQEKMKVSLSSSSQRIQKFAKKYNLKGNDKEACSLILMMDLLELNGTCIGVLKEGVFFNKNYKELRKCLIENFNVTEVISVPSDQFENTKTKTSIIIFKNQEEKTKKVIFRDLVIERYEEDNFEEIMGDIYLTENKGDIQYVTDKIISEATKEELLTNNIYSLNGKDYNKKEIICNKDYKLITLGDICNCLATTKYCTNIGQDKGKYRLYCSSQDKQLYVDFCEVKEYSIILGQGGNFNIHFDINFTPSKHVCVIQSKKKNIELLKYMYYIISELQKSFITNGSTISWLNKKNIRNFNIPIPKSEEKIKEWVDKISKPYDNKIKKEQQLKELEIEIQNKIKDIIENEDYDDVELSNIIKKEKNGKTNTNDITNTNEYNFYSATANNPSGTHNKYDFDGEKYLLFAKSGGNSKTIYGESLGIGKFWLVSGKSAGNIAMIKFIINDIYNKSYIVNYLKYILYDIQKSALYTTGNGNIKIDDMLKNFKIKIPKNKDLINNLEPLFNKIEDLQTEIKNNEILYNQYIRELSNDSMKS